MKKFIILLLFFAVGSAGFSQDVNIYWGNVNKVDRFTAIHLLGKRGDYLFGYKASRRNVSILKYNFNNLETSAEHHIIGKADKDHPGATISNDYTFQSIVTLKNFFCVAVTKFDRKTKENSLCMQEIDNEGKLTGSLKQMETIDAKSKFNSGKFRIVTSDDSTKFMLLDEPPYERYAGEKYTITLFDQNLNQTKKLEAELPFKDKYFDLNDVTYANDGNVYMMAKVYLANTEKEKGESDFYYELIAINSSDGSVAQYEIKLPGKYIDGISFDADDDKEVICSGFYGDATKRLFSNNPSGGVAPVAMNEGRGGSTRKIADADKRGLGGITGIFYMRINKITKQIGATGLKDLDADFVADLTSTRNADKGRGISNDFKLKDFFRKSDGGAIIVAEYSADYETSENVFDQTTKQYHWVYHLFYERNNIIAINVNPDGSIKWYANIPKYQETEDDGGSYLSYSVATKDDRLYFIYNDNPDNLDPKRVQEGKRLRYMRAPFKSEAVLVELSEDGQFTKKALFSNKENKSILVPNSGIEIGNNQLIIPSYNGGLWCCFSITSATLKLARFEFK